MSQRPELVYLDSSALVKLVLAEKETRALIAFLEDHPLCVSSIVAEMEVYRAAQREDPDSTSRAEAVLELVNLLDLDRATIDLAKTIAPPLFRTLDAIHIASALSLGADLATFVTYDERQRESGEAAGLACVAPS